KAAALERQGKLHVVGDFEAGKEPGHYPVSVCAPIRTTGHAEPSIVNRRRKFVTAAPADRAKSLCTKDYSLVRREAGPCIARPVPPYSPAKAPSRSLPFLEGE